MKKSRAAARCATAWAEPPGRPLMSALVATTAPADGARPGHATGGDPVSSSMRIAACRMPPRPTRAGSNPLRCGAGGAGAVLLLTMPRRSASSRRCSMKQCPCVRTATARRPARVWGIVSKRCITATASIPPWEICRPRRLRSGLGRDQKLHSWSHDWGSLQGQCSVHEPSLL
jgi:hypothetical protein